MTFKIFITEGLLDPAGAFYPIGKAVYQIAVMSEDSEWRVDGFASHANGIGEVITQGMKAIEKQVTNEASLEI